MIKYSTKDIRKVNRLFSPDENAPIIELFIDFLETNPLKKRSLIPKGGNDNIMTPPKLALDIVRYFNPSGLMLEPCSGDGAFWDAMRSVIPDGEPLPDEFEISKGKDFLLADLTSYNYSWLITNPPFSKIRKFLIKSMQVANNIVFLCPSNHLLGLKARKRDILQAGFHFREVVWVEKPVEWPSSGFSYAAIHLSKEAGDCKFSELKS